MDEFSGRPVGSEPGPVPFYIEMQWIMRDMTDFFVQLENLVDMIANDSNCLWT